MDNTANDPVESSFSGTTRKLYYYGCIGLTNTSGIDQVKRDEHFTRYCEKAIKKGYWTESKVRNFL